MAGAGAMEWGGWDCQDGVPFSRQSTQGKTKLNFEAEVQAPTEVRPGAPPTASHLPRGSQLLLMTDADRHGADGVLLCACVLLLASAARAELAEKERARLMLMMAPCITAMAGGLAQLLVGLGGL